MRLLAMTIVNKEAVMKTKYIILTLVIAMFMTLPTLCLAEIKGAQYEIAKKHASPGQKPVVIKDPDEGKAVGFLLYADLDGDGEQEIIIPYKERKDDDAAEEAVSPYKQVISIDIIEKGKKRKGFITQEVAYVYNPSPHVTVKGGKVFLMVFDGIEKKEGPDTLYAIQCRGLDDSKASKYQSVKMPWELILYPVSQKALTVTEFFTKTKESRGVYFIRPVPQKAPWPRIPVASIEELGKKIQERKGQIFWEYGPSTSWGKE
jgi:hypothetical protein